MTDLERHVASQAHEHTSAADPLVRSAVAVGDLWFMVAVALGHHRHLRWLLGGLARLAHQRAHQAYTTAVTRQRTLDVLNRDAHG